MVLVSRRSQQLLQLVRSFAIPDYLPCTLIRIISRRFLLWSLSFFLRFCLSSLELLPESFGAWFAPSDQQTRLWYAILISSRDLHHCLKEGSYATSKLRTNKLHLRAQYECKFRTVLRLPLDMHANPLTTASTCGRAVYPAACSPIHSPDGFQCLGFAAVCVMGSNSIRVILSGSWKLVELVLTLFTVHAA